MFSNTKPGSLYQRKQEEQFETTIHDKLIKNEDSLPFDGPPTKNKVKRMRVKDLRAELQRRGQTGVKDIKKDNLVALLWDDLSRSSTLQEVQNPKKGTPSISIAEASSSSTPLSTSTTPTLDPERTYILHAKGIADVSSNGTGIGIALRLQDDDKNGNAEIVWKTRQFLPGSRSRLEADYTALVVALRLVTRRLALRHVRLELAQDVLVHQLTGLYPILKESLQPPYDQVVTMRDELQAVGSFEITKRAVKSARIAECQALALQALETRESWALGDDGKDEKDVGNSQSSSEALLIDPMGREYQGPSEEINGVISEVIDEKNDGVETEIELEEARKSDEFEAEGSELELSTGDAPIHSKIQIDPTKLYKLNFDGGSRGNPGETGAGMVLYDAAGNEIWHGWKYLGQGTNNQAEYNAILLGLHHARSLGIQRIECLGDSQLVIRQLTGVYKVKNAALRDLFKEAIAAMENFEKVQLTHIARADNKRADELANVAMTEQNQFGLESG